MQMLHPAGHAPPRPVDVPVLIGALGPKGAEVARELGDGLFVTLSVDEGAKQFEWVSLLFWGTVLDDGRGHRPSARAQAAAGPGWALAYHAAYELGGRNAVLEIPGGAEWLAVIDASPRTSATSPCTSQHCVGLNDADRAGWDAGGAAMVEQVTVTGTADAVRRRLRSSASRG